MVTRVERGFASELRWSVVCRVAASVGLTAEISVRWRGGELDRLLDADHAALQASMKSRLEGLGWLVSAEVTFSRYGERGSIDLLAFHPSSGVLLAVEIKTVVADAGGLLRSIDAKRRLASGVARDLGWRAQRVVSCLVVADQSTNRRRVAALESLFGRFEVRGRLATSWLRQPGGEVSGLLLFRNLSPIPRGTVRRAGRQRVRVPRAPASVGVGAGGTENGPTAVYQSRAE